MYHIKNDKRAKTSAEMIIQGLNKCLQTKKFNDLTVSEVQEAAMVGRSTFYRNFDSLTDVLAYQYDKEFSEILNIDSFDFPSQKDAMRYFVAKFLGKYQLLESIIDSGHTEIIYQSHVKYAELIKKNLFHSEDLLPIEKDYMMDLLATLMISMVMTWLRRGRKESVDDIIEGMQKAAVSSCKILNAKID